MSCQSHSCVVRRRCSRLLGCLIVLLAAGGALGQFRRSSGGEKTDYGPALACSLKTGWAGQPWVLKGVVLQIGDGGEAAACFDTETLRWSAGWVSVPGIRNFNATPWAKLLDLQGVQFNAALRPAGPTLRGRQLFATLGGPGWSKGGSFADPRKIPYGPLPRDWAKWRGLYVNGRKAVLSYTVGGCEVLETAGATRKDVLAALTRTIHLGPSAADMTFLVCEAKDAAGKVDGDLAVLEGAPKAGVNTVVAVRGLANPAWRVEAGRVLLTVAAHKVPPTFKIVIANVDATQDETFKALVDAEAKSVEDLPALCKGGAPRWPDLLETKGRLGTSEGPYVADTIAPPTANPWNCVMRFSGLDFFPDGRAALCTLAGDVWIVSRLDAKLERVTWKRFAAGLYEPLGLKIVGGAIHVLCRDQITRLIDLNNDGEADFCENFNNDGLLTEFPHDFAMDLQADAAANFYYARNGTGLEPYDRVFEHHGAFLKVSKDGAKLDVLARGLRSPNGSCVWPDGTLSCSDNEGTWCPASRINVIRPEKFYGDMRTALGTPPPADYERPMLWFPRTFDSSPASHVWAPEDGWGPLGGTLISLSYGTSGLYWVMPQEVDGVRQAAVCKLPLRLDSGAMRGRFGPDGQLYVCGLRGWQTNAAAEGAFQRVRFTGTRRAMLTGFHATARGLDLAFSEPLDAASVKEVGNWSAEQWNYKWTSQYGSPEYSVANPDRVGHDELAIQSAELLADARTVRLAMKDLRPVMQLKVTFSLKAAGGGENVRGEAYATLNRVPAGAAPAAAK